MIIVFAILGVMVKIAVMITAVTTVLNPMDDDYNNVF